MKSRSSLNPLFPAILGLTLPASAMAADEPANLREMLRDGLYQEEVSRDPEAAARTYQNLLAHNDEERAFAATALFRFAEIRRKQKRNDEAIAAYHQLLTRYPEAETECRLARENLTALEPAAKAGQTPVAAAGGETDDAFLAKLQIMSKSQPDELNDQLSAAIAGGFFKSFSYLKEHGAETKDIDDLNAAVDAGSLEIVEYLLKHGTDMHRSKTLEAAQNAAGAGKTHIMKAFLAAGLDPNSQPPLDHGPTSDYIAPGCFTFLGCAVNDDAMMDLLLEAKADPNLAWIPNGESPLHMAARNGKLKAAARLLQAGANSNAVSKVTTANFSTTVPGDWKVASSPLDIALCRGNTAMVELLEKAGAKPHDNGILAAAFPDGMTKGTALLQTMLDHGVSASALTGRLRIYDDSDWNQIAQLAQHGFQLSVWDLATALKRAPLEMVSIILDRKAYPENAMAHPEVMNAWQREEIRPLLLSHGMKIKPGMVSEAASFTDHAPIRLLLENGGNANERGHGDVPAIVSAKPELIRLFVEKGADANATWRSPGESRDDTPLLSAIRNGSLEKVRILLDCGANPDLPVAGAAFETACGQFYSTGGAFNTDAQLEILQALVAKGVRPRDEMVKNGFQAVSPGIIPYLFRSFVLPRLEDSPNVRWFGQDGRLGMLTLEERSPSEKPRPLAESIFRMIPRWESSYPYRVYGYPLPDEITIWRKGSDGIYQAIPVKLTEEAEYPELQWGDIVDATEPTKHGTNSERRDLLGTVRQHVSFPVTVEIDGVVQQIRMVGEFHSADAARPEVSWQTAESLISYLSMAKPDRWLPEEFTVIRPGWPPVTSKFGPGSPNYSHSQRKTEFDLTAGDRLVWTTRPVERPVRSDGGTDNERRRQIRIISPGLPLRLTHTLPIPAEMESKPFTGPIPSPLVREPSALQMISLVYRFAGDSVLSYPDFSKLRIRRLQQDDSEKIIEVDIQSALDALPADFTPEQARALDVQLQAGDILELPVQPHDPAIFWPGFTPAQKRLFNKALSRTVQITDWRKQVVMRTIDFDLYSFRSTEQGMEVQMDRRESSEPSMSAAFDPYAGRNITAISPDGSVKCSGEANSIYPKDGWTYTENEAPFDPSAHPAPVKNPDPLPKLEFQPLPLNEPQS